RQPVEAPRRGLEAPRCRLTCRVGKAKLCPPQRSIEMGLDFTEEQHLMRDMPRAMLTEHCPIEVVRQMEDDPKGYPDGLWKQIGELGLAGTLIPDAIWRLAHARVIRTA